MKRTAGVLLHISSLWGNYSCGSFGKAANDFIDFLADCGFGCWQVLPFGIPDGCPVESDGETVLTLTLPKFTGVILKEETPGRNFFFKRPKSPKDKQRR